MASHEETLPEVLYHHTGNIFIWFNASWLSNSYQSQMAWKKEYTKQDSILVCLQCDLKIHRACCSLFAQFLEQKLVNLILVKMPML